MANKQTSRKPARYGSLALVVVLIAVPVAYYFFFYQAERLEAATIRNFRALDAAADRVAEMLGNTLPKVVGNAYSKDVIKEIARYDANSTEEMAICGNACSSWKEWCQLFDLLDSQSRNVPEHTTFEPLVRSGGDQQAHIKQKNSTDRNRAVCNHCRPAQTTSGYACGETPSYNETKRLDSCMNGVVTTKLLGNSLQIEDCRSLEKRSLNLHKALAESGFDDVSRHLDKFGVRSTVALDDYLTKATKHLTAYFDKYLITNSSGRAIFNSDDIDFGDHDEIQTPHRKAIPFTNHEDIRQLLRMKEPTFTDSQERSAPLGSSSLKSLRVGDVDLSIFMHPFTIQGIKGKNDAISSKEENGDEQDKNSQNGSALPAEDTVFHIVGIVTTSDLQREAIRLDLAFVVDATLLICTIIALLPIIWFWTAGNRLVIAPWVPFLMGVVGTVALLFYTVMFLGYATRSIDEEVLDRVLGDIAGTMVRNFNDELSDAYGRLLDWDPTPVFQENRRKNTRHNRHLCVTDGGKRSIGCRQVNDGTLMDNFFCGGDGPNGGPHVRLPRFIAIFSLNEDGRQVKCQFNEMKSQTHKLDLKFRPYFKEVHSGQSWQPNMPFLSKNNTEEDRPLRPYFIERIDSVIGGDKATVLSMPVWVGPKCRELEPCEEEPVVVAGVVRFESLDHSVVHPSFAYAVVEKDTGRMLFHSDGRREFVANFIRSVGNSHRLLSLFDRPTEVDKLGGGTGGQGPEIIDLEYDGVPIRALVTQLRPEIPWRLVVYRGHEIDSRLSAITSSITIFTLGFYFVLLAFSISLVLLILWLDGQGRGLLGSRLRDSFRIDIGWDLYKQRPGLFRAMVGRVLDTRITGVVLWILLKVNFWELTAESNPIVALFAWILLDLAMLLWALSNYSSPKERGSSTAPPSLVVGLFLVGLIVMPTIATFWYFRPSLTCGASQYAATQWIERFSKEHDRIRLTYSDYEGLDMRRHPTSGCLNSEMSRPGVELKLGRACPSIQGQRILLQWAEPFIARSALSKTIIRYASLGKPASKSAACPISPSDLSHI